MVRREVYDAIGGHAGVAGEVLEDVAIAMRVKTAGHRIWFGSGKGIVRVRMYRSFDDMWQGWKKNLYRLIGGTPWALIRELESNLPWIPFLLIVLGLKYPFLIFLGVLLFIARQTSYGLELVRNQYPFSFIFYYVPAVALYVAVLWASYRSHVNGRIVWKGREYAIGAPESVKYPHPHGSPHAQNRVFGFAPLPQPESFGGGKPPHFWEVQQSTRARPQLHAPSDHRGRTRSRYRHGAGPQRIERNSRTRSDATDGSPSFELRGR